MSNGSESAFRGGADGDHADKTRRITFKLLFWVSLPFGYLQAGLAELYRVCIRRGRLWLPLTALAAPLILVGWKLSRSIYVVLYHGLLALAPEHG